MVRKNATITEAIQVTMDLEKAGEREVKGLIEALVQYDLDRGEILTWDHSEEMEIEGKRIIVKPVWEWLLEND